MRETPSATHDSARPRVLLVEDNRSLAANIGEFLTAAGWCVDHAYDGAAALSLLTREVFDVIVLDLALPRIDGLTVCTRLHDELDLDLPVLMLTARDTLDDKIEGFAAGADDYLTKPFALAELDVRLHALLRRHRGRQTCLMVGDLVLDTRTWTIVRAGQPIRLSPAGVRLLEYLMRRSPAVVPRSELAYQLWGEEPPAADAALRVHIHALRSAIDRPFDRPLLKNVPGIGYALRADA